MPRRRMLTLLATTLAFAAERMADREATGELGAWSAGVLDDTERLLSAPLTASSLSILDHALADPDVITTLSNFVATALSEEARPAPLDATALAIADMFQLLDDEASWRPIARVLAVAAAPNALDAVQTGESLSLSPSLLSSGIDVAREATGADETNAVARLLNGLITAPEAASTETPLEALLGTYADISRAELESTGPLTPEEVTHLMTTLEATLRDESRGLERLYRIIQSRELRP